MPSAGPGGRRGAPRLAAAALLFAAGAAVGWVLRPALLPHPETHGELPTRLIRGQGESRWRFISPLLECETAEALPGPPDLTETQVHLRQLIAREMDAGRIAGASIYFRQLHDGPWFSINRRDEYAPASLLKIPTLIAVLKRAESEPALLTRRVRYEAGEDLNRLLIHPPADPLRPGREYTVMELCRRMAEHSDNNATRLLGELVTPEELNRVLRGLGVYAELELTGGNLNVKSLSGFFRVLYNASLLSDEMSELALEMLSHSRFREGILAGVPADVAVSSKYGEAWVSAELHQLHEFAIVYHADRPYLLGLMTRGRDYDAMKAFIAEVSRTVYRDVDRATRPFGAELAPALAAPAVRAP